jgi:hypothetical protein
MKVQWRVTAIRDGVEWQTISVQRQKASNKTSNMKMKSSILSNCSSDEKSNKNFESERFTRSIRPKHQLGSARGVHGVDRSSPICLFGDKQVFWRPLTAVAYDDRTV